MCNRILDYFLFPALFTIYGVCYCCFCTIAVCIARILARMAMGPWGREMMAFLVSQVAFTGYSDGFSCMLLQQKKPCRLVPHKTAKLFLTLSLSSPAIHVLPYMYHILFSQSLPDTASFLHIHRQILKMPRSPAIPLAHSSFHPLRML